MATERKVEFDILKGILIVLVVIGHAIVSDTALHKVIFWFHMPAFFMITGYLTTRWNNSRKTIIRRIKRLVVPYFSYSVLLFCLFHPEPLVKNIARVLYAGHMNITTYSYPFWFVNAMFVALCLHSFLLTKVNKGGVCTRIDYTMDCNSRSHVSEFRYSCSPMGH